MYKNKEFDYDLWTTETDGEKKYWVRVRNSNEVVEVNLEIMRFLRNQEKSLYRDIINTKDTLLSLDALNENDERTEEWLIDKYCFEEDILFKIVEEEFLKTLTQHQKEIFLNVIKNDEPKISFAKRKQISFRSVSRATERIQKNFKKFQTRGSYFGG